MRPPQSQHLPLTPPATASPSEDGEEMLCLARAARDSFLALLSHELRTPLTPVLSLVSATLMDQSLTPDLRESFTIIQRNVELEARLIDDLLDLTHLLSGGWKIDPQPVQIHHCIEAALELCRADFEQKKIGVRMELAAVESVVCGDFARLHQALWNLLKNAVKFTNAHGNVSILTENDSGTVVVEIRDNGLGIDPERLQEIFGAFSAMKSRPTATGLGLGLAITRAIVEGHGGQIHARSEGKDQGAVFRICLPLASSASQTVPAKKTARGKTIMVVEDHEDTRRVLSRALRRKGFGVTVAGSVEAAHEQFSAAPADLLICDIGLPDGTGWDLLARLRPHGPVNAIAVSGYGMEQDLEKSREAGFLAHLTKPIDFSKLENMIAAALAPAKGAET